MERHKSRKQQSTDDESAEIEAVSFKKFSLDVNSLTRVSVSVYYINVQSVLCMHGNLSNGFNRVHIEILVQSTCT